MAVCMVCGTDYSARGEMLDIEGTKYKVCVIARDVTVSARHLFFSLSARSLCT